jgi:hypothetical protein
LISSKVAPKTIGVPTRDRIAALAIHPTARRGDQAAAAEDAGLLI